MDESLIHDNDEYHWMPELLRRLRGPHPCARPALQITYAEWSTAFKRASSALGLDFLEPSLYQLRHGGASHELLTGVRPLDAIKKRGRWCSDASLKRYEKGGRVQQQLALLTAVQRAHCELCAGSIGKTLLQTWSSGAGAAAAPLR